MDQQNIRQGFERGRLATPEESRLPSSPKSSPPHGYGLRPRSVANTPHKPSPKRRRARKKRSGKENKAEESPENTPPASAESSSLHNYEPQPAARLEKYKMSGQGQKWREDQILIICPGSQTTMAQLGCAELTPPAQRIPTRMFKDEEDDGWRPYHTYKRVKPGVILPVANGNDADKKLSEDDYEWVEDPDSVEGAVYPIQGEFLDTLRYDIFFIFFFYSFIPLIMLSF
jgi:hypothetical protein